MTSLYIPPDGAAVLDYYLVPGSSFIQAMVDRLRLDLRNDPELAEHWKDDPRAVLGERGIVRDLQTEIMRKQAMPIEELMSEWCITTSSCCCETL